MEILQEIRLIAFDLDGTIYNGNQIIDGAIEIIKFFREQRKFLCFFTNNSGQSRKQIFEKLLRMGIELSEKEVFCCSYAALRYSQQEGFRNLYIIGSESLKDDFTKAGFLVNKGSMDIDAILIGIDIDFSYQKLTIAYEVMQRNESCKIVVCNTDSNFPVENGLRKPGCGPIVSAVLNASGRNYDFMLGKPNTYILDIIVTDLKLRPDEVLVVGDSYYSDIQMAQKYGAKSILIDDKNDIIENTLVVKSIKDIKSIFLKNFK